MLYEIEGVKLMMKLMPEMMIVNNECGNEDVGDEVDSGLMKMEIKNAVGKCSGILIM